MKLTAKDKELIAAATKAIKPRYRNDWQEVGAAHAHARRPRRDRRQSRRLCRARRGLRRGDRHRHAPSPRTATRASRRLSPCVIPKPGEPGDIAVVSPCGTCRELIHDYDAKARVIVPNGNNGATVTTIGELLPNKYRRGMT